MIEKTTDTTWKVSAGTILSVLRNSEITAYAFVTDTVEVENQFGALTFPDGAGISVPVQEGTIMWNMRKVFIPQTALGKGTFIKDILRADISEDSYLEMEKLVGVEGFMEKFYFEETREGFMEVISNAHHII